MRLCEIFLTIAISISPSRSFVTKCHHQHFSSLFLSSSTSSSFDNDDDKSSMDSKTTESSNSSGGVMTSSPPEFSSPHDELMYTLGVNLARQLGDIRPLVEDSNELSNVAKGLLDVILGRLTEDGQRQLLSSRGQDLNAIITERADNIRKRIEESGRKMLAEMSATEGTITLPSGVVIHPLDDGSDGDCGSGSRPTAASTVKVHYHGTLPDGTVFDSSLSGEPVTFALGQVIPGWKEALQKMHEGETAMIGIPPEMGYGMKGTPDGRIPGGATLFFKVQLIEVLSAAIGGGPTLLGADGKKLGGGKNKEGGSVLLGPDGNKLA